MLTKAILLLLPALAYGSIRVYIKASSPETGGHVEYIGANVDIVKDADIKTFGLEGDRLMQAVKAYSGELPSHVFVKSPTIIADVISEDIFSSFNFNQVTRRIIPMTGDIVNYKVESIELSSEVIENLLNKPNPYTVNLLDERIDTVKATWVKDGKISKGDDISYVIDFGMDNIDEIVNLSFKAPFGKNVKKEKEIKFAEDVELVLEANQKIEAVLTVDKVTMDLQVNYTVSLGGDVASYFPKGHNGQQFWGFDINEVLKAGEMPNTSEITQLLSVEFYSNPKVEVRELN